MPKERKPFDKIFPKEVSKDVKELIKHYMAHSNASSAHNDDEKDEEHFASMFVDPDGVYELDGRRAKGRKEIAKFREALFKDIPHRDHPLTHLFTQGSNDLEMMGLGEVTHKHHDGEEHDTDWATYWSMVRVNGKVLFKTVRIFLMDSDNKVQ